MAALGIGTALFATARRNSAASSPDERCAIAAEVAEELQADWVERELPAMTASAHAGGIDLVCLPDPAGGRGAKSPQGTGVDLDDIIEAGQSAELVVRMLHERVPTYPWRCEIRHGSRCVARAHYDALRHMVVLDDTGPE